MYRLMGKIILKDAVVRKPGYLYYIDKDGSVCESMMHRKTVKKTTDKKTTVKKPVKTVKKK